MGQMRVYSVALSLFVGCMAAIPITPRIERHSTYVPKVVTVNRPYVSKNYGLETENWFLFMPKETGSYKMSINSSVEVEATLYDSTKSNIIIDNKGSLKYGLANTLLAGKVYYIKITIPQSNSNNNDYSLYIQQLHMPNDEYFEEQWGLFNSYTGIDINVIPVWNYTKGDHFKIGIIDTGTDYSHVDLNKNEGLSLGYNFVHNTKEVFPINEEPSDVSANVGHGTLVAGIIGAEANNEEGICGTAPEADVVPLKILGAPIKDDPIYDDTVATFVNAIEYAQKNGIKIINCSFGGSAPDVAEREAMEKARDILFIIAAGNAGNNLEEKPIYPACYNLENTVIVGAVDFKGELSCLSNYGGPMQIVAPGEEIPSTYPDNLYTYSGGTSMAAPFVSSVSALAWASNPGLTAVQVKEILISKENVTPLEGIADKASSGGMINAFKVLIASSEESVDTSGYIRSSFSNDIKNKIKYYKDRIGHDEKTNMFIVKTHKDIDRLAQEMRAKYKLNKLKKIGYLELIDAYIFECLNVEEVDYIVDILNKHKDIEYAEPNYRRLRQ